MQKNPVEKINIFVLLIECTELIWNLKYANGLCFHIFFKEIVCYLIVTRELHNDESQIYIFKSEVLNYTPNIFTN